MSSFIQEIKIATDNSLDVIMKNGRAYRYYGIDPNMLAEIISYYTAIVVEGGSIGRFYNEYIKGMYQSKELEATPVASAPNLKELFTHLQKGHAILVGNKEELDELLKVIAEHYKVKINYQGLLKDYHKIVSDKCISFKKGELVLIPLEQAGYDNFYAYADIERIETQVVVVNEIDRKDTYFYDITLSGLEDETQWSENDFKGAGKASEGGNKEAKQNGSDEKEMALQALNLLQTIIKENEISDTDILINTVRDYIKK